jgi:hypothetical protein
MAHFVAFFHKLSKNQGVGGVGKQGLLVTQGQGLCFFKTAFLSKKSLSQSHD